MNKNISLFLIVLVCLPLLFFGQEKKKSDLKFTLKGFVKNDMFWDTRQTVSAREGHFLLFPKPIQEDAEGEDINQGTNFNFLSIQSRLSFGFSGVKALDAKVSAKIEGDFFAQSNPNINLFRLRHAYVKMNWTSVELLIGQYWIPMFITDCFPGTISFNTGAPFQPFGRSPQLRLSKNMGKIKFVAIANSQRYYVSRGPNPAAPSSTLPSSQFLRNSAVPELSLQLHFKSNNNLWLGVSGSYKQLVPQLVTKENYKTRETVEGFNALVYAKIKTKLLTFKMQGIYGQNIPDVLSIGGFGISDSTDVTKGYVEYASINTASAWMDLSTNGSGFQYGVFAGYSKNLGADKDIIGPIYGLGTNIESLYRISPRISYKYNQLKFALEGEYTLANFGSSQSLKAIPETLTPADNFRILFASYFVF